MIIRDYLICLLQMYLLEDLEKNILPYRRERFWEKFLVYCIAALAMFGTNRLESSILNMVMIPVIYMIDKEFFSIGGDSLNALKLIRKINEKYNIVITIKDLYENASVRKLAKRIIEKTEDYNEGIL